MRRLPAALAALALLAGCREAPARADKPPVLLLTSLPVLFGEEFSLEAGPSPLRDALEARFAVTPIALAEKAQLGGHDRLLLMAQPRAQTAEALVELDTWVRDGGRVLLLADPLLEWPTSRSLGDPLAPMIAFADTGLLTHWGLTLYRPDSAGASGTLALAKGASCALEDEGSLARCTVGKGRVTVIADADFVRDEAGAARVAEELDVLARR